jgi:hypothetical protein
MRLIQEAVKDLRVHPARSVLTVVGLFVAVMSIVAIYTAGAVVRGVFIASAEQAGGRAITMQARLDYGTLTPHRLGEVLSTLDRRVTTDGGEFALVHQAGAQVGPAGAGLLGQDLTGQQISLVAGDLHRVRRMPVLSGSWLAAGERPYPGGLVLNQSAAAMYGPVGTMLEVDLGDRTRPYQQQVVGVVADGSSEPQVYQSLASALWFQPAVLSTADRPQLLVHHASAGEEKLRDHVRSIGLDLGADASEVEILRADTVSGLLESLKVTQSAFLGVAVITLIVAVLGLLNIGLATVRERSRELTIRRALGATRARVFALVLCSNVLLGLLTALAAIALAYLAVAVVVPRLIDPAGALDPPAFPWPAGVAGLLAAVLAALAGGITPAIAASRVDMTSALRE